jgi:hypothetical protein
MTDDFEHVLRTLLLVWHAGHSLIVFYTRWTPLLPPTLDL